MRADPTITTYNPTQANSNFRNTADTDDAVAAAGVIGTIGCRIVNSNDANHANFYQVGASADADL